MRSVTSDWVIEEAQYGRDRNILVPVLIDDVAIPFGFRRIQAAALLDWEGEEHASMFRKLVSDIASVLGTPPKEIEREQGDGRPVPSWIRKITKKVQYRTPLWFLALFLIISGLSIAVVQKFSPLHYNSCYYP
jgi:hypothetical protein